MASLDGGTMEKLDALLGCPVILPAEPTPEAVAALPAAARHSVLTALFHCGQLFPGAAQRLLHTEGSGDEPAGERRRWVSAEVPSLLMLLPTSYCVTALLYWGCF